MVVRRNPDLVCWLNPWTAGQVVDDAVAPPLCAARSCSVAASALHLVLVSNSHIRTRSHEEPGFGVLLLIVLNWRVLSLSLAA